MAIFSKVPPPEAAPAGTNIVATEASNTNPMPDTTSAAHPAVDIDAWTISALQSLAVTPNARGTHTTSLSIPLDSSSTSTTPKPSTTTSTRVSMTAQNDASSPPLLDPSSTPRRPPSRRDSMRRREALLKGNEGSRQRRRWDMARLTDVPNVQPPLPSDWEPRPMWSVQHVPYGVAQYWDYGLRERVEARSGKKMQMGRTGGGGGVEGQVGRVPRELRETCKKAPGVKGYVKDLEEPVRKFLVERGVREEDKFVKVDDTEGETETEDSALSSEEDEEIVFVGRHGRMRDGKMSRVERERMERENEKSGGGWKKAHRELRDQPVDRGMVYDALDDGESGRFKRWLTHSISTYYGLVSKSVMAGTPARRCVYVGVRDAHVPAGLEQLPRPLCELL